MRPSAPWLAFVLVAGGLVWETAATPAQTPVAAPAALDRLSDREFWTLIDDASERGGAFHSDNFTSNEAGYAAVAATLAKSGPHGGAYLGVGPEQNFNYIAAMRPAIAIIFDIRRQAVMQHLLFKALFELSATRAEFVSQLFSVPLPDGIAPNATPDALWQRFTIAPGEDRARFAANVARVLSLLTQTHGFALSADDTASLEYVYEAFFRLGPAIDYAGYATGLTTGNTNFVKLASAVDADGLPRSFLGTDEQFQFVRTLEARNLVVPIEADLAGPKALGAAGDFLRARGLRVGAFYISNVEQYLFNPRMPAAPGGQEINGGWRAFYDNLAALPADRSTVLLRVPLSGSVATLLVRRTRPDGTTQSERREAVPLCPLMEFLEAARAGRVANETDARTCGR